MDKYKIEITDLFGGLANYSWVRRHEIEVPVNSNAIQVVKKARTEMGWTGIKADLTYDSRVYPSHIELKSRDKQMVMFIDFVEPFENQNA